MSKVLMVVTGVDRMTLADGTTHPTGFWAEELVELHRGLTAAGHEVAVATPGGVRPHVDPASLDTDSEAGREIASALDALAHALATPLHLDQVAEGEYDAIVLPGGHGPMVDLAVDRALGRLLIDADGRGAIVGVLCHGPAGLLAAVDEDGFRFAGRRLAVFTDEEERTGGLGENSPYLVASRLEELGATVATGEPWSSTVVVDRNLVSGQNPQSSAATAAAVVDALAR
jgi:putative intracellular protease/amidase